jgi:hypothetical protein
MALKRDQLEMVKILLPYFEKIENGKDELLKQWEIGWEGRNIIKYGYNLVLKSDNIELKELKKNTIYVEIKDSDLTYSVINPEGKKVNGKISLEGLGCTLESLNKAEDPTEYLTTYLPKILEATSKRGHTLKNKREEYASELNLLIAEIKKGEEAGDKAISDFRKKYLPKNAIRLNEYVDVEALLHEAYKAYVDEYDNLKYDQRVKYCINVIGFIQSLLSPETAKIFCQGLYDVVENKKPISALAESLKLVNDKDISFYRASRQSRKDLGFDFYCAGHGAPWRLRGEVAGRRGRVAAILEIYCSQKRASLLSLKPSLNPENFKSLNL